MLKLTAPSILSKPQITMVLLKCFYKNVNKMLKLGSFVLWIKQQLETSYSMNVKKNQTGTRIENIEVREINIQKENKPLIFLMDTKYDISLLL